MRDQLYDYFYLVESRHWWFRARSKIVQTMIARFSGARKKASVLDIGCGTGAQLQTLKPYGTLWGLDKSAKALEYAKTKAPFAHLMQGSFPECTFDQQFDIIMLLDVLEHIEDDTLALQKLASIMKPGAIAVITVPAYQFLWTTHDDINEHKRRYTLSELQEKLASTDLEVKKISYYNTFLFLPIAFVKLLQRFLLHSDKSHFSAKPPSPIFNIPLTIVFSIEKYFLRFMSFPFGISLIAVVTKKR